MSDKTKIEKFLQNFLAGEPEAAQDYFAQVIASKAKKIVNEEDNKEMNGSKVDVKELGSGKSSSSTKKGTEVNLSKVDPKEVQGAGDTKDKPFKKVNTKAVPGKNKPKGE